MAKTVDNRQRTFSLSLTTVTCDRLVYSSYLAMNMKNKTSILAAFCLVASFVDTNAFTCVPHSAGTCRRHVNGVPKFTASQVPMSNNNNGWTSDFDDFIIGDDGDDSDDSNDIAKLFQERVTVTTVDLSACQSRQFSLGQDLILSDFVGNMGFDEVTDWEYYYPSEDDRSNDRKVVQPPLFDASKPKRTRTSSGSVVRLFRGEFVGLLGGTLSAQGLDRRVLVKEFTGTLALQLAQSELEAAGKLQSDLLTLKSVEMAVKGEWIRVASSRSTAMERQDNANLALLTKLLGQSSFLGILGEVNLAELDGNLAPNEFYRALGVPPPKEGAVWVVYEYAGLSTIQAYASPAEVRRSLIPPKKGFFGNILEAPPVPSWSDRANYVVQGIMKQAIEAVATVHESGIVHRSIGRNSILLSSKAMDKREAVSPYATLTSGLVVKLADFGFSGLNKESTSDEEFCARARTFDLYFRKGENTIATTNFGIAEDMHALGFVFLGLLLSSLAELPTPKYNMPATDEDTLQRLLGEIFGKDVKGEFREYVEAEEIWSKVVELLDEKNGAGWTVLETLLLAREKAAKNKDTTQIFTIRGLLSNPFFN
jgi:hypothetical protein